MPWIDGDGMEDHRISFLLEVEDDSLGPHTDVVLDLLMKLGNSDAVVFCHSRLYLRNVKLRLVHESPPLLWNGLGSLSLVVIADQNGLSSGKSLAFSII